MDAPTIIGVRAPLPGVAYPPTQVLQRHLAAGVLTAETLPDAFRRACTNHASRLAVDAADGRLSFAELDDRSNRAALVFHRLGLRPLDRVVFQAANSASLVVAVLGCLKAGLIPLCTLHAHREVEIGGLASHAAARGHVIDSSDTRVDLAAFALAMRRRVPSLEVLVGLDGDCGPEAAALPALIAATDATEAAGFVADSVASLDPFQVAFFQISGGSTGVPKIIPRTHADYLANMRLAADATAMSNADVVVTPGPMLHNAGLVCFWGPALLRGATVAIPRSLRAEDLALLLAQSRPTLMYMPKPLLPRLAEALAEAPSKARDALRAIVTSSGGAEMQARTGVPVFHFFGMTEGIIAFTGERDPPELRHRTHGVPLCALDEMRLLLPGSEEPAPPGAAGELAIRGPYTFHGYYAAPERTAEAFTSDGWYRTGDLVRLVPCGDRMAIVFEGRIKDLISRGGEKIACEEVERYVRAMPSVLDVAVVPMPDAVYGERGCAVVVPAPGAAPPDVAALGVHLAAQGLARFKWPEHVIPIAALPQTSAGKLDRRALRELAATHAGAKQEAPMTRPAFHGVHHSARPTWKLRETIEFYRDVMGLPLIHGITARGWGREGHPDFLHIFFDSGRGSTIAFFYYLGTDRPEYLEPRSDHTYRSTHTAWRVESEEELLAWKDMLDGKGVEVSPVTRHEMLESVYFLDPNGYNIEITRQLRDFQQHDAKDAELTIAAALEAEAEAHAAGRRVTDIDTIWRRKADLVLRDAA